MNNAWICDAIRTPIGRQHGVLASVRPDDLCVAVLRALRRRNQQLDWSEMDDIILGCTNQAGEDNRNVARAVSLLADLPQSIPAVTVNRVCASGMDAISQAGRAIKSGEVDLCLAGGVESMSRAPFVLPRSAQRDGHAELDRSVPLTDSAAESRFVHPRLASEFGDLSCQHAADRVARQFDISRDDQDAFARRSWERARRAHEAGFLAGETTAVPLAPDRNTPASASSDSIRCDEFITDPVSGNRQTTSRYAPVDSTVAESNLSEMGDGACGLLLASETAVTQHGLQPRARLVATSIVGVPPRLAGIGGVLAIHKLLERQQLALEDIDVLEIHESSAAHCLAVQRDLGLPDDSPLVNPNGGCLALGNPWGMSGARMVQTSLHQLERTGGLRALCTMSVGAGQGMALLMERA